MCTDDVDNVDQEPTEEPNASSETSISGALDLNWNRRAFLKAAALSAAAAALVAKGNGDRFGLGVSDVSAHSLDNKPCTAQDVDVGPGVVVNEPCECTDDTFSAVAAFEVSNNNNATRYCITLHLAGAGDVRLFNNYDPVTDTLSGDGSISGFGTQTMYGRIGNFPCNGGLVCFGVPFSGTGRCAQGGCSTIAFNTSSNASCPNLNPPGGQCRHRQICIQGFNASLECVSGCGSGATTNDCSVECGGTLHLRATASGAAGDATAGTYDFTVYDPNGDVVGSATGASSPQCFSISDPIEGTYSLEVKDSGGCEREDSVEVTVESIDTTLDVAGQDNCDGVLTFTAGAVGQTGCTFTWWIDDVLVSDNESDTLTYDPCGLGHLDGQNHTVSAQASCGSCAADIETLTVNQCVDTSVS